jgi:hypothetical protein
MHAVIKPEPLLPPTRGFPRSRRQWGHWQYTTNWTRSLLSLRSGLDRLASHHYGQRLRGLKDPVELVNQAVELVLSGKRTARAQNLASLPAFVNYVQGVLQSVISHELERIVRQGETVPVDTVALTSLEAHQLEAPNDVVKEVILNENEAAVRAGLEEYTDEQADIERILGRAREPRTINASDAPRRIAKRIHRLRKQARRILLRQAEEDGISSPTPMDAVNL